MSLNIYYMGQHKDVGYIWSLNSHNIPPSDKWPNAKLMKFDNKYGNNYKTNVG